MSFFATLNPEQNGYVQVARNSPSPFDIGACFDAAFGALKRDFANLVLRNFVFMLAFVPLALLSLIPIVGQVAMLLLVPPLVIGYSRHNLKVIRGEQASFSDMFSGFDCFGQAVLMYLVMVVLLILGFFALIIPGIYLAIAWSYSWKLLAEKRGSFWECMEISRQAITPHWGWAFLLFFVAGLVGYLGIIACIVGIFATAPMAGLMHAAAYERLFSPKATA
jgi:uncharacterized membrane protein